MANSLEELLKQLEGGSAGTSSPSNPAAGISVSAPQDASAGTSSGYKTEYTPDGFPYYIPTGQATGNALETAAPQPTAPRVDVQPGGVEGFPVSAVAPTPNETTVPTGPAKSLEELLVQLEAPPAQGQSEGGVYQGVKDTARHFIDNDAVKGANGAIADTLSKALGIPADTLLQIVQKVSSAPTTEGVFDRLTMSGAPSDPTPEVDWGTAQQKIKNAITGLGINTAPEDPKSFGAQSGDAFGTGLTILLGTMAGTGPLAQKVGEAGYKKTAEIINSIGEALKKHPVTAVISELGAAPGQVYGQDVAGPAGAIPGAMAGGAIAGATTWTAKTIGGVLTKPVKYIAGKMIPGEVIPSSVPTQVLDDLAKVNTHLDNLEASLDSALADVKALPRNAPAATKVQANREVWRLKNERDAAFTEANRLEKIAGPEATKQAEVLRPRGDDPARTKVYAEQQMEGIHQTMEDNLAKNIAAINNPGAPRDMNVALRGAIENAENYAKKIEGAMWERTPLKEPVSMQGVRSDVNTLVDELRGRQVHEAFIPTKEIDELLDLTTKGKPTRDPETGRMQKATEGPPTVEGLRSFIRNIRGTRKAEEMAQQRGAEPRREYIANLNKLEAIVNKGIADAFPDDVTISQARDASNKYHDLFTKSNLFDILAMGRRGRDAVPPEKTLQALMDRYPGLADVLTMTRDKKMWGRIPGQEDAYPFANADKFSKGDAAAVKEIERQTEDAVRAEFHAAVTDAGVTDPKAVAKVVQAIEPKVEGLAKVNRELNTLGGQLQNHIAERQRLDKSALARYVKNDAEVSINKIFSHGDPAKEAKELMGTFRGDPDALRGFRAGVLDELFKRSRMDPTVQQKLLADPKISRLLETALPADDVTRLKNLTNIAYRLEQGEYQTFGQKFAAPAALLARIIGANVGGGLSSMFGGGAGKLQSASIVAQAMKGSVLKAFSGGDPKAMLAGAVQDPAWEKLLLAKSPQSLGDMLETAKYAKRIVTNMEGFRGVTERYWESVNDSAANKREGSTSYLGPDTPQKFSTVANDPPEQDYYTHAPVSAQLKQPDPYSGWAQDQSGNTISQLSKMLGPKTSPNGVVNVNAFQKAMDRYPADNPNVEDRRGLDSKTLQGWRKIVESADAAGMSQFPEQRAFLKRKSLIPMDEIPTPTPRPKEAN